MASEVAEDIEISMEMRASLKEGFDKFAGKNEKLNKKQLASLLLDHRHAKNPVTAADMAKKFMRKFNKDGDSKMNFEEYINFVGIEVLKAKKVKDDWMTETLRRAFKAADKDDSGLLSMEEITELTAPTAFELEAEADEKFDFDKSLPFLTKAVTNFESSIGNQVEGLFRMFDKEEDGFGKDEVKKAIPLLNDLLTVFKIIDDDNSTQSKKPSTMDARAPIPKDRDLFPDDFIDLFTYTHFKRLETEMSAKK